MDKSDRMPEETAEQQSKADRKNEVLALLKEIPPEQMLPLPEKPNAYFDMSTPGVFLVPLAKLQKTRARENGITKALPFMYAAAHGMGSLGKRKPISVSQRPDGMYDVVDGNSTYAVAARSDWKLIPAVLVEPDSH